MFKLLFPSEDKDRFFKEILFCKVFGTTIDGGALLLLFEEAGLLVVAVNAGEKGRR
jgi:hypothetical protein